MDNQLELKTMDFLKFKRNIKDELKKEIHKIDHTFDIDSNMNLLTNILQLDLYNFRKDINDLNGTYKSFFTKYLAREDENADVSTFGRNFEQFVKLIYLLISKDQNGDKTLSNFKKIHLKSIESEKNKYEELVTLLNDKLVVLQKSKLKSNTKNENEEVINLIKDKLKTAKSKLRNIEKEGTVLMLADYFKLLNYFKHYYKDNRGNKTHKKCDAVITNGNEEYFLNDKKEKEFIKIKPGSLKTDFLTFDDVKEYLHKNSKFKDTFHEHLIYAVVSKNLASHTCQKMSNIERYGGFNSILISMLYLIDLFHDEISEFIKFMDYDLQKIEKYLNDLDLIIKGKNIEYIPLDIIELTGSREVVETTIDEAFDENNQLQLLGNAGAGKSTSMEHLVLNDIRQFRETNIIPIIIPLSSINENSSLIYEIEKICSESLKINFKDKYNEGKINLYLDGVNEITGISSEAVQQKVINEINSLAKKFPDSKLVVTDRLQTEIGSGSYMEFPSFIINELSSNKVEDFIIRFAKSETEISVLNELLNVGNNFKHILQTPLMITVVIELINNKKEIPDNESKIIQEFLKVLFEREKIEKKDTYLKIQNHSLILGYIANIMHMKFKANMGINPYAINKMVVEGNKKYGFNYDTSYFIRVSTELNILCKDSNGNIKFSHERYKDHYVAEYELYEIA